MTREPGALALARNITYAAPGHSQYGGLTIVTMLDGMEFSISHEVADFIDDGRRLLGRLQMEGSRLSDMEIRILSSQLRKISMAVSELHDSGWGDRQDAA